jgi:hypothetical protein
LLSLIFNGFPIRQFSLVSPCLVLINCFPHLDFLQPSLPNLKFYHVLTWNLSLSLNFHLKLQNWIPYQENKRLKIITKISNRISHQKQIGNLKNLTFFPRLSSANCTAWYHITETFLLAFFIVTPDSCNIRKLTTYGLHQRIFIFFWYSNRPSSKKITILFFWCFLIAYAAYKS